jgi:DNA-binding NarL/FixJ family response regulator
MADLSKSVINIILADDHLVLRRALKSLLENESDFVVSGEASNGSEVLDLLAKGTPADIIIADLNMPLMTGQLLIESLTSYLDTLKIIVLSALDSEPHVIKAMKAGASGYLLKNVSPTELIFAIRHTNEFGLYLCAELAGRFLNRLIAVPQLVQTTNPLNIEFSDRDVELLRLIAEGYTSQEIAEKLFSSVRTIEKQRLHLINKTESRNTVVLILYAKQHGII